VPVYDAMRADPSRGIPAAKVFAALRKRHMQRLKKAKTIAIPNKNRRHADESRHPARAIASV
jgi:hypothetical protein